MRGTRIKVVVMLAVLVLASLAGCLSNLKTKMTPVRFQ